MKKIKLLAALGIASLLMFLVGCDIPTEADLNGGEKTPGGSTFPLWSTFEGADMQVWQGEVSKINTATLDKKSDCLEITIGNEGWWGMCFCNQASVGATASDVVTFDMSKIKTITFEAKASQAASIWVSQSDKNAKPTNQTKIELSTDFETKTYTLQNPGKDDYGVLDIGGGDLGTTTKSDVVISIKNIKFLDENGKETVPTRNE